MIALAMFMANAVFTSGQCYILLTFIINIKIVLYFFIRIQHWNLSISAVLGHNGYMCNVTDILLWKRVCQLSTAIKF